MRFEKWQALGNDYVIVTEPLAPADVERICDRHTGVGADGVCANLVFPSPGRLVRDATAAAVGIDVDEDPWTGRRLPWSVLEVIDGCAGEDWCVTLGRHLGIGGEGEIGHGRAEMEHGRELDAEFTR